MKTVPRVLPRWDLFDILLFLYFLTLHADQLSFKLGTFTLRWNNFLAGFLLLTLFLRYRSKCFIFDKKFTFCLGLTLLSMTLSFLLSPYKNRCVFFICFYSMTLLYYVVLPYLVMSIRNERKTLRLYLTSFFVVGLYAGLQLLLGFFHIKDPFVVQMLFSGWRPNALCFEPSFYALYMTPFIVIVNGYYLLKKDGRKIKLRHLLFINFLFVLSTSTTTLFVYFVFLAFFFSLNFFKAIRAEYPHLLKRCTQFSLFFASMIGFCSLVIWKIMQVYFLKFFHFGFVGHHSFYLRWNMMVNAFKIFLRHPFLGVGMGGIPSYIYDAWLKSDPNFIYLKPTLNRTLKSFEATNVFTEILASLGLFGLMAFAILIYFYFKKAKECFFMFGAEKKLWVILFSTSFFINIVILQFNQNIFRTYIWVHLALSYVWMIKNQKLHRFVGSV